MNEEKDFGKIEVNMRDNNYVEHIGHKIIFNQPQPNPNSIYQNGNIVGSIGAEPQAGNGFTSFEKLFFDTVFDLGSQFTCQGIDFKILSYDDSASSSIGGRPMQTTLWRVKCQIT